MAQEIITAYHAAMTQAQRLSFFRMLCGEFFPDEAADPPRGSRLPGIARRAQPRKLTAAVESPRQELLLPHQHRAASAPKSWSPCANTCSKPPSSGDDFSSALDADLKHLFRSWFNRGFLRLERISWQTSALILEKLIRHESVHEINGWPDLRRRLEADRRCFAFFHPALVDEPIIFVEVALSRGLTGDMSNT